jgi:hypothetical protein
MKGFSGANPSRRGKSERMENLVDMAEWPKGDFKTYRMVGPIYAVCNIWFTIATKTKPNGQSIPKMCLDLDGATDKFVSEDCPYRKSGLGRESKRYYVNVIDRDEQVDSRGKLQDFPPPRGLQMETHLGWKAYWAKKGDTRKTPCRILEIPDSCVATLNQMSKLNRAKDKSGQTKSFDLDDNQYGCDISIMIDESKKGAAKYVINKGERTPITLEERKYMFYRPDLLKSERLEEAKREMKDLEGKIIEDEKSGKGGKSSGRRNRDEDDGGSRDNRRDTGKRNRGREEDDSGIDDDVVDIDDSDLDGDEDDNNNRRDTGKRKRDDDRGSRSRGRGRDEDEDNNDGDEDELGDLDLDGDSDDGDEGANDDDGRDSRGSSRGKRDSDNRRGGGRGRDEDEDIDSDLDSLGDDVDGDDNEDGDEDGDQEEDGDRRAHSSRGRDRDRGSERSSSRRDDSRGRDRDRPASRRR